MAKAWLVLISFLGGTAAHSAAPLEYLDQTVWQVTRAYARHAFELIEPTLDKKPSAVGSELFPAFGMPPKPGGGVSWELSRLNAEQSELCVKQTLTSVTDWNAAVLRFSKNGLTPADPGNCSSKGFPSTAPNSFPATMAGLLILDRRDTPSRTVVPGYPVLLGVDSSAVVRPGMTVSASAGATLVTVFNPYIEISPGVGAVVGVTSVETRSEFTVSQNCAAIATASGCTVAVTYNGVQGAGLAGQLKMHFSNGAVANIGLLGVR